MYCSRVSSAAESGRSGKRCRAAEDRHGEIGHRRLQRERLGDTKPTNDAYSAPARPAIAADSVKTRTLMPVTSTPEACAPSSLPCTARIARPGRLETRLAATRSAPPATPHTSQYRPGGVLDLQRSECRERDTAEAVDPARDLLRLYEGDRHQFTEAERRHCQVMTFEPQTRDREYQRHPVPRPVPTPRTPRAMAAPASR